MDSPISREDVAEEAGAEDVDVDAEGAGDEDIQAHQPTCISISNPDIHPRQQEDTTTVVHRMERVSISNRNQ
jgi:hypothetical protein